MRPCIRHLVVFCPNSCAHPFITLRDLTIFRLSSSSFQSIHRSECVLLVTFVHSKDKSPLHEPPLSYLPIWTVLSLYHSELNWIELFRWTAALSTCWKHPTNCVTVVWRRSSTVWSRHAIAICLNHCLKRSLCTLLIISMVPFVIPFWPGYQCVWRYSHCISFMVISVPKWMCHCACP
jgi:hypothetical protein